MPLRKSHFFTAVADGAHGKQSLNSGETQLILDSPHGVFEDIC